MKVTYLRFQWNPSLDSEGVYTFTFSDWGKRCVSYPTIKEVNKTMKISFDVNKKIEEINERAKNFEPIPEGIYRVRIEKVEDKPTKAGGIQLSIQERVTDGNFANRVVFQKINLVCPTSEVAERIGQETLSKIAFAAGIPNIKDTAQLVNKIITVKVIQSEFNGRVSNEVKSVVMPKKTENVKADTEVITDDEIAF